ncbi:MAG TPA: S41 family peptidase [Bacteroidia bacterium]|jgi:hypothetical protein|nr:S41 family peptidase [Bacteroidia bacterium]
MPKSRGLFVCVILFLTSCSVILNKQGIKNLKDPITSTAYYQSLNAHQQDFLFLRSVCDRNYPDLNHTFPKPLRDSLATLILKELAKKDVSELAFRLYLKKYISHFNSEHTWVSMKGLSFPTLYPFEVYTTDTALYLLNLGTGYNRELIGQKITAVNHIPVQAYERKLMEFVSAENELCKKKAIQNSGWNLPALHEFIGACNRDSLLLSFESGKQVWIKKQNAQNTQWHLQTDHLPEHPITRNRKRNFEYQTIDSLGITYFQFHACYDQVEIREGMKTYVKPWLVPLASFYLNRQMKKKKPSKLLQDTFDPERPSFDAYISQMIAETNKKGIHKLVIDLRHNLGGSELICLQLLYHLTANEQLMDFTTYVTNPQAYKQYFDEAVLSTQEGIMSKKLPGAGIDSAYFLGSRNSTHRLFDKLEDSLSPYYIPVQRPVFNGRIIILANYNTFSAGALFTALLQDNHIGTVIGTPVSNNPTGASGWTPFHLPNSKIECSTAMEFLVRPDPGKSAEFIPDIPISLNAADLMKGRDPLFDKAMEVLKQD